MATYHLLIKTNIENQVAGLKDCFYSDEVLINSSFKLTYKIKNIGSEKFPGGKIEKIGVSFSPGGEYLRWSFDPPLEIPEIVQQTSVSKSVRLRLLSSAGVFGFTFRILPNEKAEILYYTDPSGEGESNQYTSSLYTAVDRRQVEMVAVLRQILNNLKKE